MSEHPDIAEDKLEAIKRYLDAIDLLDLFQDILVGQIEHYRMKYPKLLDDFWNNAFREPEYDDFLRQIIPIYDKYYTTGELSDLTEFFGTVVGRKYLKTEPLTEVLTRVVTDRISENFKTKVLAAVGER
ncbi:MAG: DUF2059 domain-containing protein [Thermoplasmata archaeon]|nr:DUF2059 domain-containing protein [Thermoplasmata archaeon]